MTTTRHVLLGTVIAVSLDPQLVVESDIASRLLERAQSVCDAPPSAPAQSRPPSQAAKILRRWPWFVPYRPLSVSDDKAHGAPTCPGGKKSVSQTLTDAPLQRMKWQPYLVRLSNTQLGVLEEVRTQTPQKEWDRIVANVRMLRARFEPESVVKKPVRRRRAGGT